MSNPWFRLYTDILNDEKILSISQGDRWCFVAVLCLKCEGVIDKYDGDVLDRKVGLKLRLTPAESAEHKRRLIEENLIDADWQPVAWDERQFISDNSTQRVRKYREKQRKHNVKRDCNVSVTVQDTDTDTDTDTEVKGIRDLETAFEIFNDTAGTAGLPKAQKLTASRQSKLKARLKDCGGLEGWVGAMNRLEDSDYCTGKVNGWKADLDFVLQEKSFTRLMEGSYDNRSTPQKANSQHTKQMEAFAKYAETENEQIEDQAVDGTVHRLSVSGQDGF